jgi:hypothetical protein
MHSNNEKKSFQKETTLRSPKPNWIEVIRNQHNNVTENKSKLKRRVKCPKTSNNGVVRDTRAHEPERNQKTGKGGGWRWSGAKEASHY